MNPTIPIIVTVLYVHLFNAIAELYFDSNQTMTWSDLYRRFAPPMKVTIEL